MNNVIDIKLTFFHLIDIYFIHSYNLVMLKKLRGRVNLSAFSHISYITRSDVVIKPIKQYRSLYDAREESFHKYRLINLRVRCSTFAFIAFIRRSAADQC